MDRAIKKKNPYLKYAISSIGLLFLAVLLFISINYQKTNIQRLPKEKLFIEDVKFGIFRDYISVLGEVEPFKTIYLDAAEGGRVEDIYVEEGAFLKKGDPIIRLSNKNLLLEISNYEAQVARAINELKTTQINLENQNIRSKTELLELEYRLKEYKRKYSQNKDLIVNNYISREEFINSEEIYHYTLGKLELLKKKYYQDSISMNIRIATGENTIETMQYNLALIKKRIDELEIKAPYEGELAALNIEIGEVIISGTRIGILNILDSYILKTEIDEHYLNQIYIGLVADCQFGENRYKAELKKIFPEVKEGKFIIKLEFSDIIPEKIKIGQTSIMNLELGKPNKAILIKRGAFFQSTGGQWIFKLDKDGKTAYKQNIKLGKQNPQYYEVIEGLKEGDKVITSSYNMFEKAEKLILY